MQIELDIEITCDCGSKLSILDEEQRGGVLYIKVYPCDTCMDAAYDQGKEETSA